MYTIICYVYLHASVLSSLATHHATKHDWSDTTALPNENGQFGVGPLQINIVLVIAIRTDSFTDTNYFNNHNNSLQHVAQSCTITKKVRSHD